MHIFQTTFLEIAVYPDVLRAAISSTEGTVLSAHCGLVLSGDFLTTNGCSMIKCEQGWHSGESTCSPPNWPGQFKFQHGHVR